jgi:hypothetical protein
VPEANTAGRHERPPCMNGSAPNQVRRPSSRDKRPARTTLGRGRWALCSWRVLGCSWQILVRGALQLRWGRDGGTTRIRTLRMSMPIDSPTRRRRFSVWYRSREAHTEPVAPTVRRPPSMPALATASASLAGRAAQTCCKTKDRSIVRDLRACSAILPPANNSLTLLELCGAICEG